MSVGLPIPATVGSEIGVALGAHRLRLSRAEKVKESNESDCIDDTTSPATSPNAKLVISSNEVGIDRLPKATRPRFLNTDGGRPYEPMTRDAAGHHM